jgi:hypothetical protein
MKQLWHGLITSFSHKPQRYRRIKYIKGKMGMFSKYFLHTSERVGRHKAKEKLVACHNCDSALIGQIVKLLVPRPAPLKSEEFEMEDIQKEWKGRNLFHSHPKKVEFCDAVLV